MARGITVRYGDGMAKALAEADAMREALVRRLQYIGERAVEYARNPHANDWTDRTGNLRASVGYAVLVDGSPVASGGLSGSGEGAGAGESLLARLRSEFPRGLVLVVCAGMLYASYVESRGFDVLAGAELQAERMVRDLVSQMGR